MNAPRMARRAPVWRIVKGVITMGLLAWLLGCSDPKDFRREGDRWTYLGRTIEGADPRSFRVLDAHHAKDARRVWYADTERRGQEYYLIRHVVIRTIDAADPATFEVLRIGYARDRGQVYHEGTPFPVADPAGFELLDSGFARDRRQGYYQRVAIAGSQGGAAFRVLDGQHADDGRRIYHARVDYRAGATRVHAIEGADRSTFEVLEDGWARDARRLYHAGVALPDDPAGWRMLGRGYVRTASRVYYLGQPVKGADAASFEVVPVDRDADGADGQDARRRYRGGAAFAAVTAKAEPLSPR